MQLKQSLLAGLLAASALALAVDRSVLHSNEKQQLDEHGRSEHIIHSLKRAEIIPTVIDSFVPAFELSVAWAEHTDPDSHSTSSKHHGKHKKPKLVSAELGNTIKPKKLQHEPHLLLAAINESAVAMTTVPPVNFIVALTDPDAPSRKHPDISEMCHWIVRGVALEDSGKGNLTEVVAYKAPAPPAKTGKHRYVAIAFAPLNGTSEPLHLVAPNQRKHWGYKHAKGESVGMREWAKDMGLVPVAANFIYAKNKKQ